MIRRCLNGETWLSKPQSSYGEYIAMRREPGELKHLSSRRKRKQHVISKVAASERERAQTGLRAIRGSDCKRHCKRITEWFWESQPERVKAPYVKSDYRQQDPEYHETRETLWE